MLGWFHFTSDSRRRAACRWQGIRLQPTLEVLEDRQLLSATKAHASGGFVDVSNDSSAVASATSLEEQGRKAAHTKVVYPDISGQTHIVTQFTDYEVEGVFDFVQHGRRIQGTLTNDSQAPTKFKGKYSKLHADTDEFLVELMGTNNALASDSPEDKNHKIKDTCRFIVSVALRISTGVFEAPDGDGGLVEVPFRVVN